jgi:hypothetical protein
MHLRAIYVVFVSGAGSVCDQEASKFLSLREELMAGHMGVNRIH